MKITLLVVLFFALSLRADNTQTFTATAYSHKGRMANGKLTRPGVIAADTRVLPMGTKVRILDSPLAGDYVVSDTGGAIKGRKIDIWVSSRQRAIQFGRRKVKLMVLTKSRKGDILSL